MPMHDRIIPYLERDGLYHLARLNNRWFWLDEHMVSAFIERWRPKTHTFYMPFGECTVTLQDVAFQLGLPIDGRAVSGCLAEFENFMEGGRPAWERFQDLFGELPPPNKVKQMTVQHDLVQPHSQNWGHQQAQQQYQSQHMEDPGSERKVLPLALMLRHHPSSSTGDLAQMP
ncbi:hypothetical protein AHAS_Ahas15G0235000 [Arachis hypogaea]